MSPIVFAFPEDTGVARKLAVALDAQHGEVDWHRFPDRESLMTLPGDCERRDVIFVCTLTDPDTKSLPLYFCAATARDSGARKVGLVAPYLGYMRQDRQFSKGQARSAQYFAKFLSGSFDWLVTVEPHLHRVRNLGEVFSIPAIAASAMPAVTEWIRQSVPDPVIIGPDRESAQWVETVARSLGAPRIVLEKIRSGDRSVAVSAPDSQLVRNRNPVIVDDIVSSGCTLAETLGALRAQGTREVSCVIIHPLFAADAEAALRSAGARRIVSSNTVAHSTNAIDIVPSLVAAVRPLLPGD